MKIGVIYLSYNNQDYLEQFLSPWLHAKEQKLGGHEFIISAVSLPFAEYKDMPGFVEDTTTYLKLETLIVHEFINYLTTTPQYMTEAEARSAGLAPLLMDGCDIFILVDGDEYYEKKTIEKMLEFVELNRHTSWFSFNLRNYIYDDKHYLEDMFTPPRIFRTKTNGYTVDKFYFDNDLTYKEDLSGKEASYKTLPSMNFPKSIYANHFTWLNNLNSKNKIAYQLKHFGHCSYKWDDKNECVLLNEEYFAKYNLPVPMIIREA